MSAVHQSLANWADSQCHKVDIGGLFARSNVAHKWKATFRSLSLRESVAWRTQDLLSQSVLLHDHGHMLGARILLRSSFETVAVLIYLNQLTRRVLAGTLTFNDFSDRTTVLLLGSRDESTAHKSLNIVTILEKCDTRYPGMADMYAMLSESAHPNYEGMAIGYSDIDRDNHIVSYSNKWKLMFGSRHLDAVSLCIKVFYGEYNEEWPDAFEKLERWLEQKDEELETVRRRT